MKAWFLAATVAATAFILGGCGGGGGTGGTAALPTALPPAAADASAGNPPNDATVTAEIDIPLPASAQSGSRTPQYVSSSTKGLAVFISQPSNSHFTPTVNVYDLTSTTSCHTATITLNCSINIPAPSGTDELYFITSTQAPSSGAMTFSGLPLDANVGSFAVAKGLNTISLNLYALIDGVKASETGQNYGIGVGGLNATTGLQTITGATGILFPGTTSGVMDFYDAGDGTTPNAITTSTVSAPSALGGILPANYNTNNPSPVAPPPFKLTPSATTPVCGAGGTPFALNTASFASPTSFSVIRFQLSLAHQGDVLQAVYSGGSVVGASATVAATFNGFTGSGLVSSSFSFATETLGVNSTSSNWLCANQQLNMTSLTENDIFGVYAGSDVTPGDFKITPGDGTFGSNGQSGTGRITDCANLVKISLTSGGSAIPSGALASPGNVTGATALTSTDAAVGNQPSFYVTPLANPAIGKLCVVQIADVNPTITNQPVFSYLTIQIVGATADF